MDNQVPEVVVDRYSYHKVFTERCLVVAKVFTEQNACKLLIFAAHISPAVTSYDHALISETFFDLLVLLTFLNDMLVKELLVYCFNNWRE